jgi:predicted TPR repeat methyltransferase
MTIADFEAQYRADPDPWNYGASEYERSKYEATLLACGAGPFSAALELGGSIGVFSAMLAPRCERLMTIDFSPTAVRLARARLLEHPHAQAIIGTIPDALPAGPFDLVVASEVLYYLSAGALERTLSALERRIAPGGRLVLVHWRAPGPERPLDAMALHEVLRAQPWLSPVATGGTEQYLLDVLDRG